MFLGHGCKKFKIIESESIIHHFWCCPLQGACTLKILAKNAKGCNLLILGAILGETLGDLT